MIKNVLIDLDGTLLPMNQDEFLNGYFKVIGKKFKDYDVQKIMVSLNKGINAMLHNDGVATNEKVFWEVFFNDLDNDEKIADIFLDMYKNEFQSLIKYTKPTLKAKKLVDLMKRKGLNIYVCTNPLFPTIATYSRLKWANLNPEDFNHITTYENSSYCKPNINYYIEVLEKFDLDPKECIMIGNDVLEDLVVNKLGIKTFLLTDNLINTRDIDFVSDYEGNFDQLLDFFK
ncbi:MAG: HAD family hydrolase [Bacilli bacterium]